MAQQFKKRNYSGWGNYKKKKIQIFEIDSQSQILKIIKSKSILPIGMSRSYGDSSLSKYLLRMTNLNRVIFFDTKKGVIEVEAGITINQLLKIIIPSGWFVPVTPGTSYVTVGGCIASDVHGKNHHIDGTFSEFIDSIKIILGNSEIINISKKKYSDLFHATCGGMGLTGVIISAKIYLKKIHGILINRRSIKTKNLDGLIEFFSRNNDEYNVAWLNTSVNSSNFKRGIFYSGFHSELGELNRFKVPDRKLSYPFKHDFCLVNGININIFNFFYMNFAQNNINQISINKFFYPLDSISNWNMMYGKLGFIQFQFVIPEKNVLENLNLILDKIKQSGSNSFLSVLKKFGPQNKNYLSFPIKGFTLTLDFRPTITNINLISYLESLVIEMGGRINLCKDVLMNKSTFRKSYTRWEGFEKVRSKYYAHGVFYSDQSRRLGLS